MYSFEEVTENALNILYDSEWYNQKATDAHIRRMQRSEVKHTLSVFLDSYNLEFIGLGAANLVVAHNSFEVWRINYNGLSEVAAERQFLLNHIFWLLYPELVAHPKNFDIFPIVSPQDQWVFGELRERIPETDVSESAVYQQWGSWQNPTTLGSSLMLQALDECKRFGITGFNPDLTVKDNFVGNVYIDDFRDNGSKLPLDSMQHLARWRDHSDDFVDAVGVCVSRLNSLALG